MSRTDRIVRLRDLARSSLLSREASELLDRVADDLEDAGRTIARMVEQKPGGYGRGYYTGCLVAERTIQSLILRRRR